MNEDSRRMYNLGTCHLSISWHLKIPVIPMSLPYHKTSCNRRSAQAGWKERSIEPNYLSACYRAGEMSMANGVAMGASWHTLCRDHASKE